MVKDQQKIANARETASQARQQHINEPKTLHPAARGRVTLTDRGWFETRPAPPMFSSKFPEETVAPPGSGRR